MNSSAAKVGEIFTEAGAAFNRLAEMTMMLHPLAEQTTNTNAKTPIKRKIGGESGERQSTTVGSVSQVTLNMLNAQEADMDVEDEDVKLEFESSTEEVAT